MFLNFKNFIQVAYETVNNKRKLFKLILIVKKCTLSTLRSDTQKQIATL